MNRNSLSPQEREFRSRLAQLMHHAPFLRATINTRLVTCGKSGCRCAKGERHRALYLVCNAGGKKRQMFIPADLETEVKAWVETYHGIQDLLEKISERTWERVRQRKEQGDS